MVYCANCDCSVIGMGTKLTLRQGILVDTCSKNMTGELSDLCVNVVK